MRSLAPLALLVGLAVAPALTSCHTTKEEKLAFQESNFEAQFDGAESSLDQAADLLDDFADGEDLTGAAAALGADIDHAYQLLDELRAELERALASGESEALRSLASPAIVLVRMANDVRNRAESLGDEPPADADADADSDPTTTGS